MSEPEHHPIWDLLRAARAAGRLLGVDANGNVVPFPPEEVEALRQDAPPQAGSSEVSDGR